MLKKHNPWIRQLEDGLLHLWSIPLPYVRLPATSRLSPVMTEILRSNSGKRLPWIKDLM